MGDKAGQGQAHTRATTRVPALHRSTPAPTIYLCHNRSREGGSCFLAWLPTLKSMGEWLVRISFDQADFLGSALDVTFCKRYFRMRYFPKNRWVKVAIKLISMSSPIMASAAANITNGLCRFVSLLRLGKKPRP